MADNTLLLIAPDEEAMVNCGATIAAAIEPQLTIYLQGDLGMGKTTLSRGLVQAFGHRGAVKSPTYTLVEPYTLDRLTIYHFDLYRLGDPEELEYMGIRDYFSPGTVCLIEWPERGFGVLPPADLTITIERQGSGRRLALEANTPEGKGVLQRMAAANSQ